MSKVINGKAIAAKIESKIKKEINWLKIQPKLVVIFVGRNSPSQTYIKRKQEATKRVGIDFVLKKFPANISKLSLIKKVKLIQKTEKPHGLIIQLPLPEPLWTSDVLNAVNPKIDADCLTDFNQAKLLTRVNRLEPPTPAAVMEILRHLKINLRGKNITVVGTGRLVGKPLAVMLANAGADVTACDSKTENLKTECLKADVIVTAVGKRNLLTADMVKKGAVVIDTGIIFINHKMFGDVDFANVKKKARFITPVPGGVGPITVAKLLENTVKCAEKIVDK